MKNLILTILTSAFIIQGCTQKKEDSDILVFESTLSNKNAKELNEIVKEFDNFLLARFPSNNSLDSSYKLFLTKICLSDDFFLLKSDSLFLVKLRNRFSNSGLQKELLLTPDTMFLINENKSLFRRYIYIEEKKQVLIDSGYLRYTGFNDFKLFACSLKSQNIKFSDYFIKRIIVVELLTQNSPHNSSRKQ